MPAEVQEKKHPQQFPCFATPDGNPAGFMTVRFRNAGKLDKVSLRGLFLRTNQAIPLGSVGKVGVEFKNWFFRATAVVRSVEPGRRVGLEFIKMNSLDRQALRLFCGARRRAPVENS